MTTAEYEHFSEEDWRWEEYISCIRKEERCKEEKYARRLIEEMQYIREEQFFQNAFREKLKFGHVKYDEMIPNLKYRGKTDKVEFDIALVNGDSVALIEVKNRIHPSAVKELAEEKIEKFKKYFPEFQGYAAYLGIAGFSFSDEVVDRASTYGIGIIGQKGDSVELKGELKAY